MVLGIPFLILAVVAAFVQWATVGRDLYQLGVKLLKFWGYGGAVFITHTADSVFQFLVLSLGSFGASCIGVALFVGRHVPLWIVSRAAAIALVAGAIFWLLLLASPFLEIR